MDRLIIGDRDSIQTFDVNVVGDFAALFASVVLIYLRMTSNALLLFFNMAAIAAT